MRKLLALVIAVAIVFPLMLAALSLVSVSQWALDRNFYEQLLGDTRLYEVMLQQDIPNYINNRHPVAEADMIPASALSNALRTVVTPEDLRAQSLRMVNDVFDAVEGRTDGFELYLDTTQIKQTLQTPAGAQKFAQALATSLPACTSSQTPVASGGLLMRCLPSNQSADEAATSIAAALPAFLNTVPDQISLQSERYNWARWTRGTPMAFMMANSLSVAIVIMFVMAGAGLAGGGVDRRRQHARAAAVAGLDVDRPGGVDPGDRRVDEFAGDGGLDALWHQRSTLRRHGVQPRFARGAAGQHRTGPADHRQWFPGGGRGSRCDWPGPGGVGQLYAE